MVLKNAKERISWPFLSSSWVHKIKTTKERTFWRHRKLREKSQCRKKIVKPNPLCCLVMEKATKTMVPKGGTLWKQAPKFTF